MEPLSKLTIIDQLRKIVFKVFKLMFELLVVRAGFFQVIGLMELKDRLSLLKACLYDGYHNKK